MSTDPASLPLDQQLAIEAAVDRLVPEFDDFFNAESIARCLRESYDQLLGASSVSRFVPVLAERFARERLQALARAEGLHADGKPAVLFLCVHNTGRSQMALGLFRHHAAGRAVAWSGGSSPAGAVSSVVIEAMAEKGIEISGEFPKPWTDEVVRAADVVITMGCGEACPLYPGKRYEEWHLADPDEADPAGVRRIRDDVERHVLHLLEELDLPARS